MGKCKCGHAFEEHFSNSPNSGYGCEAAIETPKEFKGGYLAGNWRCSCDDYVEDKSCGT